MQFNQHNQIKKSISETLNSHISDLYQLDQSFDSYNLLSPPPKKDVGEYAFPCFTLAKSTKKAPNQIAKEIEEQINSKLDKKSLIKEVKAMGPYLNFFLSAEQLAKVVISQITDQSYYQKKLSHNPPKTMIEFSQPNTHKEMHVGHMRNLCLGDAIVNIHRYCGFETIATTFPGDVGTHVAKCLWFMKHKSTEDVPAKNKGAWLGTLYSKGNNLLEDEKGSEKEQQNKEALTKILKELENKKGEYYELWKETRQWSIELMQKVYNWANVSFDKWYWESDVDSSSVELVKKYYEKGLFIKDDGAIGIDLSEDKLGFCLLLKSDGTGLYATKDIELARKKFEDHKVEKNIYVVDNRQSRHFKQVFKTLEKMGFKDADKCSHLQYEMVELADGAMSSRKGNVVPLTQLIERMQDQIKGQFLMKYKDEWSPSEINETAKIIAAGAIKYGMTRVDSNKKIVFIMDDWLKLDGESGPYIQYVCARINSMLEKNKFSPKEFDASLLSLPKEKELIIKLNEFNEIICQCLEGEKTHILTGYLYELSKMFNSYYADTSITKAQTQELIQSRSTLAWCIKSHLTQGFKILGIKIPKRM